MPHAGFYKKYGNSIWRWPDCITSSTLLFHDTLYVRFLCWSEYFKVYAVTEGWTFYVFLLEKRIMIHVVTYSNSCLFSPHRLFWPASHLFSLSGSFFHTKEDISDSCLVFIKNILVLSASHSLCFFFFQLSGSQCQFHYNFFYGQNYFHHEDSFQYNLKSFHWKTALLFISLPINVSFISRWNYFLTENWWAGIDVGSG